MTDNDATRSSGVDGDEILESTVPRGPALQEPDSDRYEWTVYETADEERAMIHDTENDSAWIDSTLLVEVTR